MSQAPLPSPAAVMQQKRPRDLWIILILGALSTISPFSIDMYLPAFPEMAKALNATVPQISLSVSSYFVGFAIGQIFYGPLLDRFGRKPPLYVGLLLYFLATLACLYAGTFEELMLFRFVQALGGCVAMVASTSMVRDFFGADKAGKVFSLLVLIIGVSPLLAPTLGGFMTTSFGWRSVFLFLLFADAVTLLAVFFFLPESHVADRNVSLKPKPILRNFAAVLREPQFYTFATSGALSFAGLFVYVAGSPIIFMETYHLSAKAYGLIFALLSVGFIGGSQVNLLLLRWYRERQIFSFALLVQCLAAVLLFAGAYAGVLTLPWTLAGLSVILLSLGLINPNAAAIALGVFHRNVGSASSLLGFLQIGCGAIASVGVGAFSKGSTTVIFAVLAGCTVLAFLVLKIGERRIPSIVAADPSQLPAIH